MLRTIRILLAIFFFTSISLLFLDFTGTVNDGVGWMAKLQLLPAVLSLNIAAFLGIVVTTLLMGRFYCSTLCPLGIFQDIVSWLAGKRKKNRFVWQAGGHGLRYSVLFLFCVLIVSAVGTSIYALALLIEPYSIFGRMVSQFMAPVVLWVNNLFAFVANQMGGYLPGPVELRPFNGAMFAIAAASLAILFVMAWRRGRLYCNSICPVGTMLGLLSPLALFKPRIHNEQCVHCGLCEKNCKSSCIDSKRGLFDYSRCVVCGDCIKACKTHAIQFQLPQAKSSAVSVTPSEPAAKAVVSQSPGGKTKEKSQETALARRGFLTTVLCLFAVKTVHAQTPKEEFTERGDGGLAPLKDRGIPLRKTAIVPPGAASLRNFQRRCTACQLCISACPNHVLQPSSHLKSMMRPEMSFEYGWCRPECTECSQVCPTGAIQFLSTADKSSQKIGHSVWTKEHCIVLTDDVQCDNCARHCPTEAIQMVLLDPNHPNSKKIPIVDDEKCIGCGACEFLCPARPVSALHVEGHERHRTI
ncbi:MAG: 4Fe-4S binding protein [Planctomycetia bacterium]|nr:4Fe-4S binding protein [Planctomycetia bacterium]